MYMKKEVTVDVSTKMKKIGLENYDIMVLLMNSKTNDNNNYHVSVECLNIDDGEIYENIEGSFFETIEEADEYFDVYDEWLDTIMIELNKKIYLNNNNKLDKKKFNKLKRCINKYFKSIK